MAELTNFCIYFLLSSNIVRAAILCNKRVHNESLFNYFLIIERGGFNWGGGPLRAGPGAGDTNGVRSSLEVWQYPCLRTREARSGELRE